VIGTAGFPRFPAVPPGRHLFFEQVGADHGHWLRRSVLSPMVNVRAFGEHLAGLVGPVGAALTVFCQTILHYVSQRRTLFVAMKGSHSARFNSDLPDANWRCAKSSNPCLPCALTPRRKSPPGVNGHPHLLRASVVAIERRPQVQAGRRRSVPLSGIVGVQQPN
jgi:hypothetical protein